jgi:putative ABC transport system permease protein
MNNWCSEMDMSYQCTCVDEYPPPGRLAWHAFCLSFFSLNFAKLVIVANVIARPIAYAIMHGWLGNYAYRTSIQPWLFLIVGGLGLGIAFLSVGYQTFRAATANPVDSLRYE